MDIKNDFDETRMLSPFQMDNLQELFSYQAIPPTSSPQTIPTTQAQLQLQSVQQSTQAYGVLQTTCTSATCGMKESIIYATATPTPAATAPSIPQPQQQAHINLQHFNYDPNTQWISMPVIPAQGQQTSHIQQVISSSSSIEYNYEMNNNDGYHQTFKCKVFSHRN